MRELKAQNTKMEYAILRIQKLKSAVAVRNSLKHAFREQETPNADSESTPNNTHIGAESSLEAIKKFNAGLPITVRKNAVLALEYLITASPEVMESKSKADQDKYFVDALAYLHKTYGADNVFYAGVHRDETTPHLYAYVLPIKDGKLNARHFVGGHKERLSEMQTEFAETVGRKHGLERGVKGSKARHQEIGRYYAKVNEKTPQIASFTLPEKGLLEKKDDFTARVMAEVNRAVAPRLNALNAKAKATDDALERARVAEEAKKQAVKAQQSVIADSYLKQQALKKSLQEKDEALQKRTNALVRFSEVIVQGGEVLENERNMLIKNREDYRVEQEAKALAERKSDRGFSR
jgi:membrane-associated HD superfamily phosphohydrolase